MQIPTKEKATHLETNAADASTAAASTTLQALLEAVRRESQQEPHVYLAETEVPYGGE